MKKTYRLEIEIENTKGVRIGIATLTVFNPVPAMVSIIKKVYLAKIVADDYIIMDLLWHTSQRINASVDNTSVNNPSDFPNKELSEELNGLENTLVDIGRATWDK